MTTSTHTARALVDELARSGVREAVLSPGSRSAPVALALHAADAAGRIRLHVRVDERTAGFLALGLAKASRRPVPVLTTSGTAVANLHPAVLEASHADVALLLLTADRPVWLRHSGANQTTDQTRMFGPALRHFVEVVSPLPDAEGSAVVRATVSRAVVSATGAGGGPPGPVQLNLPLAEPLLPTAAETSSWPAGRPGGAAWTAIPEPNPTTPYQLPPGPRTLVVAGDGAGPAARLLAESGGWPLLAEPSSGARTGGHALAAYRLLLEHPPLRDAVERAVVYGRPTLSRAVTGLLGRRDVEVVAVSAAGPWPDPGAAVTRVVAAAEAAERGDPDWLAQWRDCDAVARAAMGATLAAEPGMTPYGLAGAVWQAVPTGGLLVVGSSHPVRDLDLMAAPHVQGQHRLVLANRGLSGIDGTLSTAIGAALGRPSARALAYVGDLTFLHDSNGLLIGPDEPRPELTVVVANDDGGSVFSVLEQGDARHAGSFERVFGTPTGADLSALCRAYGIGHARVEDASDLALALARAPRGIEVVEVTLRRGDRRRLDVRLRDAVTRALSDQQAGSSG